jgi:hypothetical protein
VADNGLLALAKTAIGAEHGLSAAQARRLVGSSAAELHDDAKRMAKELGQPDPSERSRDERGRYSGEHIDMNRLIRGVAGR